MTMAGDDTKLTGFSLPRPNGATPGYSNSGTETPTPPPIELKGLKTSALHIACTILRDGIEIRHYVQALRSI